MVKSIEEAIAARPEWVTGAVRPDEARELAKAVVRSGATAAIEIGVGSGMSSAVIFAALAANGPSPRLHAYDNSEAFRYNREHRTGDAFAEIHGSNDGFVLTTGVTAATLVHDGEPVRFAFIDGSHFSPWASVDLLSVSRFLAPGAIVGLHDIHLPIMLPKRAENGPRDLFRAWPGEKWVDGGSPNIGFLAVNDPAELQRAVSVALSMQWDRRLEKRAVRSFLRMTKDFGAPWRKVAGSALRRRRPDLPLAR